MAGPCEIVFTIDNTITLMARPCKMVYITKKNIFQGPAINDNNYITITLMA